MNLRVLRTALWGLVALAAIGLGVLLYLYNRPEERRIASSGVVLTADFDLVNQNGVAVTQADFRDRPTAWFFGFTHCPDVCPTQLASMTAHLADLGPDADRLNVVLITVDPERDTADVLRAYLGSFDPRIVGLTGALSEIEEMARGYFAFFEKVPMANGDYTMEHTAGIFVTSAAGELLSTLDIHEPRETQLAKLRMAIAE